MPLLSGLLQALLTQPPQLNTLPMNTNGNISYIDPNTNADVTQDVLAGKRGLYANPSFWTKVVNPGLADDIYNRNMSFQGAPTSAYQQNNTQRQILGQQLDTVPQNMWPIAGNRNASTTFGQYEGLGPSALRSGQGAVSDIAGGVPQEESTARFRTAAAQSEEEAGAQREAIMRNLLNYPETQAATDTSGTMLAGRRNVLGLNNFPTEANLYGTTLNNQLTSAQGERARLPYTNAAQLAQAETVAGTAGTELENLPRMQEALRADSIGNLYSSLHPNIPANPFAASVNPSAGTITPGRVPIGTAMQASMYGSGGFGSTPQTVTLGSGRTIQVPSGPQPVNPLSTTSSKGEEPTTHSVKDYPGYSYDDNGRVYKDGEDITGTVQPDSVISRAIQHNQLQHKALTESPRLPIGNAISSALSTDRGITSRSEAGYSKADALRQLGLYLDANGQLQPLTHYTGSADSYYLHGTPNDVGSSQYGALAIGKDLSARLDMARRILGNTHLQ